MIERADSQRDVQCDRCKALHPLRLPLSEALPAMDRLNNSNRPCPRCGACRRWVLLIVEADRPDPGDSPCPRRPDPA